MKGERTYRMYGLVPYNISPIQQGIQYGHALQEYNNSYFARDDDFAYWRARDKTFIILNGGTTNKQPNIVTGEPFGTMNQHLLELNRNGIETAVFYEPDLGDQLTAIVFLVEDRVFDKETYPDLSPDTAYKSEYDTWVESVGGEQNVFLRDFLSQFRLA